MNIHFSETELADRRGRACQAMQTHGIEGLLVFRQESMFYLTGYDTIGYVFFQCLYLGADGAMFLLTRGADLRQARHTSVIEEIHVWVDEEGAEPAVELSRLLDSRGCRGKRLGVEWDAFGLTAHHGMKLRAALDGFAALEDASYLVSRLRLVKSPAELDYVRKAGELADAALAEAECLAAPGAFEGDILAAMQSAVFRGDGDYPGNEFIIGSSEGALLCRYYTGRRTLGAKDQMTLEFAGVYRHYHAVLMRTVLIGEVDPRQRAMHATVVDALSACEEALCPGRPFGDAFDAHARVLEQAGYGKHRLNACGYSLGGTFAPTWMDWPLIYRGNPIEVAPGMVVFFCMMIFDSESGLAMTLGRTSIVTEGGCESVSKASLELVMR